MRKTPTNKKYYVAYSPDEVIWGTGRSSATARKDAVSWLKDSDYENDYDMRKLKTCECTKTTYDHVRKNGWDEGEKFTIGSDGILRIKSELDDMRYWEALHSAESMNLETFKGLPISIKLDVLFERSRFHMND